jgi:hypothetical protein
MVEYSLSHSGEAKARMRVHVSSSLYDIHVLFVSLWRGADRLPRTRARTHTPHWTEFCSPYDHELVEDLSV